jgi:alanine racemase
MADRYNRSIVGVLIADPTLRKFTRPTWADVSLGALQANFESVQRFVGSGVKVCAVVKADAYGHGAEQCALALEAAGANWFGVTTTDEGVPLREAGLQGRILLMTGFWHGEAEEVVRQNLTATVWETWHVEALDRAADDLGAPPQPVHLKIDTGMGRLGVTPENLPEMCDVIKRARGVALEGVLTHFASSEVLDARDVTEQMERFAAALREVRNRGLSPVICHMDNTGGMLSRPETHQEMVRPGLALYGYSLPLMRGGTPVPGLPPLTLEPVLSWKTRILAIKSVAAGKKLGYGGTFTTKAESRIASLPVGYADGYSRELSNRGRVIVCGQYAPIVGAISMDLTLVDVTAIPGARPGDEVLLIGKSGSTSVTAAELAHHSRTVPYEVLCGISKRVARNFVS